MRPLEDGPLVIAGAGSIGGWLGGVLAAAGRPVRLFGRPRMAGEVAAHGLRVTDYAALDRRFAPDDLPIETEPGALAEARIVLVCVKSGATAEMGALIAAHAPPDAIVVSCQNGVRNADVLREAIGRPTQPILAGMIPFNVVAMGEGRLHRATSGAVKIAEGAPGLAAYLTAPGVEVEAVADMPSILWGKLLLNLNNALNALSDQPLLTQLQDRQWRRLLADQIAEGLAALKAAGVRPMAATGPPPGVMPPILRLPTPLFRMVAAAMLKIDPAARSSMWEDLQLGRPTEIDELQGAILALAEAHGAAAPIAARVTKAIRAAEAAGAGSPGLTPDALRG